MAGAGAVAEAGVVMVAAGEVAVTWAAVMAAIAATAPAVGADIAAGGYSRLQPFPRLTRHFGPWYGGARLGSPWQLEPRSSLVAQSRPLLAGLVGMGRRLLGALVRFWLVARILRLLRLLRRHRPLLLPRRVYRLRLCGPFLHGRISAQRRGHRGHAGVCRHHRHGLLLALRWMPSSRAIIATLPGWPAMPRSTTRGTPTSTRC